MSDIWPVVHAERRALAADLADLSPEQWQTPSLCAGWSVHDVLAHMVATTTGRKAALDELTGPGVAILRSR
jgi:uncharacterized protein (TIGR03083 family)